MKHISFSTQHARVDEHAWRKTALHLQPEIARVREAIDTQYTTRYASINAPADVRILEHVKQLVAEKEALNPSTIVLVGIGGSNLATIAILHALYGDHYHHVITKAFYCADTVDTAKTREIAEIIDQARSRQEQVLLIIISKSGTTTETMCNAAVFIDILKNHDPDGYHQYIVAITEHGSSLWYIAEAAHWSVLEIPMLVGGRYCAFTAVGLFPLAMLGVDIESLQLGAYDMRERCILDDVDQNPAAGSALALYHHYQKNIRIHDTFVFSPRLAGIGAWYRQLLAESIGKKRDDGTRVGITPTVSVGSTDLHSLGQLYIGGPRDRFTTFVGVQHTGERVVIPSGPLTDSKSPQPFLNGKTLATIMKAIFDGTCHAYEHAHLPFITLELPEINPPVIAAFMQMKMMEIMYLAYLLEVNAFDQPDVETYKTLTQKILAEP